MDFDRLVNNNGIYLYEDDSFNTITIKLSFLAGSTNRDCAVIDLLCSYLNSSNQNFSSDDDIDKRKRELYDMHLHFGNSFYSNQKMFSLNANLISPNAINDDYLGEAFDFIRKMLKEPDFTNEEMLEIVKRKMLSNIELGLLDNEVYASNEYYQRVLHEENKVYEYSTDMDYISNLINSITLDDLKKQYEYIVNSFVSGFVFGNITKEQFNSFVNSMSLTPIKKEMNLERSLPTCEDDIELEIDGEQSYIYVTYDIDNLSYSKLLLLRKIMNSSIGLCYQTLREKYGLVYSSYAAFMYYLKKMYFYAEIDKDKKNDFLKALDEIVETLRDKEKLDSLIEVAKSEISADEVTLSEEADIMLSYLNDYILKLYEGKNRTETFEQIQNLTSEDLIQSTMSLRRKNVFMVRSSEDE